MIPAAHKHFIENAISRLEYDSRVLGLAALGSWLRGELSEFSDLELLVILEPGRTQSILENTETIARSLGTCLSAFTENSNSAPDFLTCLYDEPLLHVRLSFISLGDFSSRRENPVVLWERNGAVTRVIEEHKPEPEIPNLQSMEDRFWTWLHYAATRLGEGEIFEALNTLGYLRSHVLGPLIFTKAGKHNSGTRRLEQQCTPEELRELTATVAPYEAKACEKALKAAAKMYVGLRETLDPGTLRRNRRSEMATLRLLHEVSEKLR